MFYALSALLHSVDFLAFIPCLHISQSKASVELLGSTGAAGSRPVAEPSLKSICLTHHLLHQSRSKSSWPVEVLVVVRDRFRIWSRSVQAYNEISYRSPGMVAHS